MAETPATAVIPRRNAMPRGSPRPNAMITTGSGIKTEPRWIGPLDVDVTIAYSAVSDGKPVPKPITGRVLVVSSGKDGFEYGG